MLNIIKDSKEPRCLRIWIEYGLGIGFEHLKSSWMMEYKWDVRDRLEKGEIHCNRESPRVGFTLAFSLLSVCCLQFALCRSGKSLATKSFKRRFRLGRNPSRDHLKSQRSFQAAPRQQLCRQTRSTLPLRCGPALVWRPPWTLPR